MLDFRGNPDGHLIHTGGVASSKLAAPTIKIKGLYIVQGSDLSALLNPLLF